MNVRTEKSGIYNKRIFGDSKIESCGNDDLGR